MTVVVSWNKKVSWFFFSGVKNDLDLFKHCRLVVLVAPACEQNGRIDTSEVVMVPFCEKDTFVRRQCAQHRSGLELKAVLTTPHVPVFVRSGVFPTPVTQTAKPLFAQPTTVASARTAFVTTACHCAVPKVEEHQLAPLRTRGGRTHIVWSPISEFGLL